MGGFDAQHPLLPIWGILTSVRGLRIRNVALAARNPCDHTLRLQNATAWYTQTDKRVLEVRHGAG